MVRTRNLLRNMPRGLIRSTRINPAKGSKKKFITVNEFGITTVFKDKNDAEIDARVQRSRGIRTLIGTEDKEFRLTKRLSPKFRRI